MATRIDMPKLSDTMEEGIILKWRKKEGDSIKQGEIIADVQSDKADMELEAYETGVILKLFAKENEAVKIGFPLIIIGKAGEDFTKLLETEIVKTKEAKTTVVEKSKTIQQKTLRPTVSDKKIKASPLAKKIASEKNIDLSLIVGTGPLSRVVKRDVENFSLMSGFKYSNEEVERVPITLMRKTIARRLAASKSVAPHFYITSEINMNKIVELRNKINIKRTSKISFNDFIVKGVSIALDENKSVNASWNFDSIIFHKKIHIGVAVATEDGLTTPIVKNANEKSLEEISEEIKQLAIKARERKLKPEEYQGSTFTISNLGMFDVDNFTAIINPPESAILAVGSIVEKPIVTNGKIEAANIMKVTLSCDHRVIDGANGGKFLQNLKQILEKGDF